MHKFRLVTLAMLVALAVSGVFVPHRAEAQTTVDPSWNIQAGEPNSCTVSGSLFISNMYVNISGSASEQGTLTAEGFGQLGYTIDNAFGPFVGFVGFTVFVPTPYSLPAHTPLTLTVTTYNGPNFTGGVSYVSTLTWDCTTGETIVEGPGCDLLLPIPPTAVGGTFVADAPVYWKPGQLTSPLVTIAAGNSARVLGLDASGQYYKIIWVCDFVWVPVGTLGPNYDAVWNGAPLPTAVVQ
jgi:hypothetical protein